jgi:hypothetical protein
MKYFCHSFNLRAGILGAVLWSGTVVDAGELKVDIGPAGRPDLCAPHFVEWPFRPASPAMTFGGVTVRIQTPDGKPGRLDAGLYKFGLDYDARLACDGVFVKDGAVGDGLELIISGLSAGPHTIATYHNSLWPAAKAPGRFNLLVDGVLTLTNLQPTIQATNDYETTTAFVRVNVQRGREVVLKLVPAGPAAVTNIVLNGFEIDAANPANKAVEPAPANDDEHVNGDLGAVRLGWTAPASAAGHRVYFGTNAEAVASAGVDSPLCRGVLQATHFAATNLNPANTYFWRVDEVDAASQVTQGEVWRFRIRHLAFPTAEGYGRFAQGGRGGRVIEVTNLEDYDADEGEAVIPGSFRAAVEAVGPRTLIFRTSGLIRLKKPCAVHNPYCTVAGQTAPGDGICLANYASGAFGTHDVIIRYLRYRVGDEAQKAMDGAGLGSCDNCIIDHCSISWSSDEGTSSRGAKNITFQRSIVAEALHHGPHYRASDRSKLETHAFAASISGNIGSYHHNLLADCTDRNWSLAGGLTQGGLYAGYLDIRNNVVYNWTARTTDGGVKALNYVNNYYKPHLGNPFVKWLLKLDPINPAWGTESYYMTGNVLEGYVSESNNWAAFENGLKVEKQVRVEAELFPSYVQTLTAREAYTNVLANVGANFPKMDRIDRHIIADARNGTTEYTGTRGPTYGDRPGPNYAGFIDTPSDDKSAAGSPNFPWPEYKTYDVPADSDHDGIPDAWEKARGLNPNDPEDANGDLNGDGYTNLEKYLNSLVGEYPLPAKNQPL